jgi:hypothetical protein
MTDLFILSCATDEMVVWRWERRVGPVSRCDEVIDVSSAGRSLRFRIQFGWGSVEARWAAIRAEAFKGSELDFPGGGRVRRGMRFTRL